MFLHKMGHSTYPPRPRTQANTHTIYPINGKHLCLCNKHCKITSFSILSKHVTVPYVRNYIKQREYKIFNSKYLYIKPREIPHIFYFSHNQPFLGVLYPLILKGLKLLQTILNGTAPTHIALVVACVV